ncbi:potassium channel family protein [Clostridium formicaceticum]|uniref:Ktr system potassium uptake protein A n=1 Tax=Clostridium formicaceticum TaxID=1497 RepID=A0AAC9RH13_9CLOT|nr:TrkA family potassium uptake protein [Clostridium formicaceticum]AOY76386.1 potassium transporter Trk [Clostridium formicaceticum]ARE86779.1 Ktr system potassium uptake protein A [Clostridium formicaceticum]
MKQYVIIGCGRFGRSVAENLYKLGHDVLAIDENEETMQNISDKVTHAVQADATDENALRSLGLRNFDVAVITIGSDIQSSIMATLIVKDLGVKYVVAKAQSEIHAKVLYKIGADRVVFPERDMGMRVAHNLVSTNILDYIELAPEYSIMEITALDEWDGKTLLELNIRSKFGINIMAVKHGSHINVSPTANDVVHRGDVLVVIGHNNDLKKLQK